MSFNIQRRLWALGLVTIGVFTLTLSTVFAGQDGPSTWKKLGLSSIPVPYDEVIPDPATMLTWDQKERVIGFRNTYRMYDGDVFTPGEAEFTPLVRTKAPFPVLSYSNNGKKSDITDYIKNQSVTDLLILKNGEIVYEFYGKGNSRKTLWTSRSVAKSIVSVLMGMAVQDGVIESVDDPIVRYLPELEGSAWEKVTLHQLMQHTSGIAWNEDYTDPESDFAVMTQCEAGSQPFECVLELVKTRPAENAPGEVFSYNTGGAWLVGALLERVTGMSIAQYLEKKLWQTYPMEYDGVWQSLVKGTVSMGGHGFNATLRDWGRVGLFVQNNGVLPNGERLLPENWIELSTTWSKAQDSVTDVTPEGQYGYQWWNLAIDSEANYEPKTAPHSDETFWGLGIYGQYMGINQKEKIVLIQWSVQENAESESLEYEQVAFFNALIQAFQDR